MAAVPTVTSSSIVSSMLIKLTTFFRDKEMWVTLDTLLRELVQQRGRPEELRIWSAGCATGEEAYSIAIAAAEALGPGSPVPELKVFGTDVDEAAIAHARRGIYLVSDAPVSRLHSIFRPFFTTKGSRGTGLGLAMAYGVVSRAGGTITAANRPEGGALFTLTFPALADPEQPEPPVRKRAPARRVPQARKRAR